MVDEYFGFPNYLLKDEEKSKAVLETLRIGEAEEQNLRKHARKLINKIDAIAQKRGSHKVIY